MKRLTILRGLFISLALIVLMGGIFIGVVAAQETDGAATVSLIVKMVGGLSQDEQAAVISRDGGAEISSIPALRLHTVEVLSGDLTSALLNYQSDPQVERVEVNQTRKVESLPPDPLYSEQWALSKIGWDSVFGSFMPLGQVTVAILDTGVDASHPDLNGNIVAGTSIIDGSAGTTDLNGHGTQLAGIVAAVSNNTGIVGVGFSGVKIMPVAVLGADGTGQDSDIIAGVLYAVDHGADVILMGFSNPGFSQNLQDAIDYAWSRDVVLVAAVGNDAISEPTYPAGDRGVIGVSATDSADALAPFSNYGKAVFLAAPGVDILTTDIDRVTYPRISGTSASAALVAGVAGFLMAYDPTLANGEVVGRLATTTDPAGISTDETGNGRINMLRAVSDTSLTYMEPAGAPGGGPYVGPYVAASYHLDSVDSPSTTEGNSGTKTMTFHVTVTGSNQATTLYWRTMNGTATGGTSCTPGVDYLSVSQLTGEAKSANFTIDVTICGDTTIEPDETFTFQVADNSGFSGSGSNRLQTGTGTIQNDDTDSTPPVITPNVSGTLGDNGWYTGDVTVTWTVTDAESTVTSTTGCDSTTITTDTTGTTVTCSATSSGGTSSQSVTIKRDATPPSAALSVTAGTAGTNGWYTSDVTVSTSGADSISGIASCTADQYQTTETTGTVFNGSCTNNAGLKTDATSLTVKLDKTAPTAELSVTAGTAGAHGWYTSDVTVHTSGTDSISSPVTCTADQYQTTETTGNVFNGSCTNDAGLKTDATSLTVKLDKTAPTGVSGSPNRAPDHNGWYNHAIDVVFTGTDSVSGIDSCTTVNYSGPDSATASVNGTCTDAAGNSSAPVASSSFQYDATPPTLNAVVTPNPVILNGSATADPGATDSISGVATQSCGALDTGTVGSGKTVTCTATDTAGNFSSQNVSYNVIYASGGMCLGSPGHSILQPIDADGSSIFKQKSTVPAKFRVCDANGVSIGTPGVISSFRLYQTVAGTVTSAIDDGVTSTTPDTAFRWSATDQQWIFNMNTKGLQANITYFYRITLNDGSSILFNFGLK